eukprot:CAMPEP_0204329370 /NCGR_PEP_ID=MMETSP0469-20131031/14097_1 /ASSEMBLY_ACC=CAM_ASM_000384 /TAXON_ID=2969 /ORGANISM="Oxyrrhis marina" /LENGTH=419 /DNA_ID=CAMNT_0051311951 /DNA_START=255 /DNA_END=1514 /DNA_ORIENTATION=-
MTVHVRSPGPIDARSLVPPHCARSISQPASGRRESVPVPAAAPSPGAGDTRLQLDTQASPSNREVSPELDTPSLPSPDVEVTRSTRQHLRRLSAQSDQSRAASNASWVLTESSVMQLPREDGALYRKRQHMLTSSLHDIHECSPIAGQKPAEGPSPSEVRLEVTILELQQELERHQELLKEKCALIETLTAENNSLRSLANIPGRESASTSSGVSLVVTATEDPPPGLPSSSAGSDVSVETRLERTPAASQNKVDSPGTCGSEAVLRSRNSVKSINSAATTSTVAPMTMSARPATRTPTSATRSGSVRESSARQKKEQGLARSQSAMSVGYQSSPPSRRMRSSSLGKFSSGTGALELSRGANSSTESVAAQGAKIMASWSAAPAPTAREDPARGPGRVRERSYSRPWAKAGDTRFRRRF